MPISGAIAQLRTTDLHASISFYVTKVGLSLEFQYQDFYAGIRAGGSVFHLKRVDERDPSIEFVDTGEHFDLYFQTDNAVATADLIRSNGVAFVKEVHETAWGTREFVIRDDQGHAVFWRGRACGLTLRLAGRAGTRGSPFVVVGASRRLA